MLSIAFRLYTMGDGNARRAKCLTCDVNSDNVFSITSTQKYNLRYSAAKQWTTTTGSNDEEDIQDISIQQSSTP